MNSVKCDFCSKSLSRLDNLNAHIKRCHKEVIKIEPMLLQPPPKPPKAPKSRKIKSEPGQPAPKTHICPTCNKAFAKSIHLRRHMKLHEEGRNKIKCDMCDNEYADKKSMHRHRSRFHFGQKFTCGLCGKDFGQSGALKTHISSFHEKKHFACGICNKVFSYKSTVISHMKICHEGGGKTYNCEHCEKSFNKPYDLRRHVENIHQGQNSVKCNFCSKSLTRMDNLYAHLKRCHKDEFEKNAKVSVKLSTNKKYK